MRICIVIPVHNEAKAITRVVKGIMGKEFDVIVFDDGSTDGSGALAKDAGAHVIENPKRMGKGYSLREGFKYAIENNYDGVITMDGDGQHAPEDLDGFFPLIEKDPTSVIVGNRMADTKNMPFIRMATNKVMSWLISAMCRHYIPDTQCGFRYISVQVLKEMNLKTFDFEIETEILMKASKHKFSIVAVPIQTIYEDEKSKINPVTDTIRFFNYIFKELFSK